MALIKTINRNGEILTPRIADGVALMENATVVGDVTIGEGTSVWFNAVLRRSILSGEPIDETGHFVVRISSKRSDIENTGFVDFGKAYNT